MNIGKGRKNKIRGNLMKLQEILTIGNKLGVPRGVMCVDGVPG